jgi:hypothetical protein
MITTQHNTGFLGGLKNLFVNKRAQHQGHSQGETIDTELLIEEYHAQRSVPLDAPTYQPMATRTVDYSHVEYHGIKREAVIADLEAHLLHEHLEAPIDPMELAVGFAGQLIEKGGKFLYCERIADAVEEIRALAAEHHWAHVFNWENEIKDAFCENNFQKGAIGFTLENSDAVVCLCETLIADNGSLILNPKQASRRRLLVFPPVQIIIAETTQLTTNLNKAIDIFNMKNKGELPSVLDLHDNSKGLYYHDGNLVMKAEGTPEVYVFLVEEKIPKSTRS